MDQQIRFSTPPRHTKRTWVLAVASLLIGTVCLVVLIMQPWKQPANALPKDELSSLAFTPYFYNETIPGEFTLKALADVQIQSNLLIIKLGNKKGQSVVITQQAMPQQLKNNKVQGDEAVTGAHGSAAVSFEDGRTVGTLLTKDNQTMVTINTSNTTDSNTTKDLLRALRPVKK